MRKKVFIWKSDSWLQTFIDAIPDDIKALANSEKDSVMKSRDSTLYNLGVSEDSELYQELISIIKGLFKKEFSHIRLYHLCRPTNLDSYYKNGIQVLDKSEAHMILKELFLNEQHPHVTEQKINKAINKMKPDFGKCTRSGVTHLVLDYRYLIRLAGHYGIYGSEYLYCLAVSIGCGEELKETGTPTVFEFDVPVSILSEYGSLYREILEEALYQYLEPCEIDEVDHTETLYVEDVKKIELIEHFHPEYIPDPFRTYDVYDCNSGQYNYDLNYLDIVIT